MKTMRFTAALLLAALAPTAVATTGGAAQPVVSAEAVARINFGDAPERVGVDWGSLWPGGDPGPGESIADFFVDGKGDIYIGDTVQGCVKKFRPPGTLLFHTEALTDIPHKFECVFDPYTGKMDNLQYFAVDSAGAIYATHGSSPLTLSKFDSAGTYVWSRAPWDLLPESATLELGLKQVSLDSLLHADASGYVNRSTSVVFNSERRGQRGLQVDKQGNFVRLLPGYVTDPRGYPYRFTREGQGPLPATLVFYDPAQPVTLTPLQEIPVRWDPAAPVKAHSLLTLSAHADRAVPAVFDPRPALGPGAEIDVLGLDRILMRLDNSGRIVDSWRFPRLPFSVYSGGVIQGRDGHVYRLRFDPFGFDVVRYTHHPGPDGILHPKRFVELVTEREGEESLAALRQLAIYISASAEWAAQTRHAVLTSEGGTYEFFPDSQVVRFDAGDRTRRVTMKVIREHLWVSLAGISQLLDLEVAGDAESSILVLPPPPEGR
ncbi:MAG: hypothetical protein JSV65_07025 [Armatimonadota bacterium]|nr:MAG: hypothetical protein JSV65_07025 [Armatimonadota bacterium]